MDDSFQINLIEWLLVALLLKRTSSSEISLNTLESKLAVSTPMQRRDYWTESATFELTNILPVKI